MRERWVSDLGRAVERGRAQARWPTRAEGIQCANFTIRVSPKSRVAKVRMLVGQQDRPALDANGRNAVVGATAAVETHAVEILQRLAAEKCDGVAPEIGVLVKDDPRPAALAFIIAVIGQSGRNQRNERDPEK